MNAESRVELVETLETRWAEPVEVVGDYTVPVDPMDDLYCESCQ